MAEGNLSNGCLSNFEELSATSNDVEQMKNIDNLLKCGICYEYFTTCVVTECSHNFCSLCIRKYIQYKTECPVCFKPLYDSQLRANRIVDNLVNIFPDLKDRIIRHLRTLKTLKPNCIYVSPQKKSEVTPVKTSVSRKSISKTPKSFIIENTEAKESNTPVAGSSRHSTQTPEPSKVIIPKIFQSPVKKSHSSSDNVAQKHVKCPVCSVDILERNINLHLDDCLNRSKDEKKKEQIPPKRQHLPKLVYRLMSEKSLRSKVKEHGLNAQGDFETLKNRLQKYTALYNAECDKTDPRPVQDIIRQLEREEKALSSQKLPKSIFNVTRDEVSKEELNEQYLKENKPTFQKLIESVKQRKQSKIPETNSDNEKDSKENILIFHCEPSTSKSSFSNCYNSDVDTKDWIDIEEHDIKHEPAVEIKEENVDQKPEVSNEADKKEEEDDDDDFVSTLLQKSRRKSKRNLFRAPSYNNLDSDDDDNFLSSSKKSLESSDDIYSNHSDDSTDFEDHSSSPVLEKKNARKRGKKETRGKNIRKRKK
ncbi:E3 ubiquitin-protein ligase RAD18-like [Planococcus citri]|uniref:E3 ubiquitin-protein ligase RAD18-like n=1 Tax=Planococcus citri TaxID=170843 RepID=UPI0031F94AB9